MRLIILAFFLCLIATNANGQRRPAELRGSREQRIEQNTKAIGLGFEQITTDQELLKMVTNNLLVELKDAEYYFVDRGVTPLKKKRNGKKIITCPPKENKVFVLDFTAAYVELLARDFFLEFGKKLKVTSGARSLEEQLLMRTEGSCYYTSYAAEVKNYLEESLHVRGNTIDISRKVITIVRGRRKEISMSSREVKWMRDRLIADKLKGIEFETEPIEENICYHVVVFPKIN
ncbi:MAG: hypothetical protein HYT61_00530 [Candidatus Yanofskybacteria bacterium]|nr:hypothetical protein [Candidatus Yanofskybacteria bacterium]